MMILDDYWEDAKRMSCNQLRVLPGHLLSLTLLIHSMVTNSSDEKAVRNLKYRLYKEEVCVSFSSQKGTMIPSIAPFLYT